MKKDKLKSNDLISNYYHNEELKLVVIELTEKVSIINKDKFYKVLEDKFKTVKSIIRSKDQFIINYAGNNNIKYNNIYNFYDLIKINDN